MKHNISFQNNYDFSFSNEEFYIQTINSLISQEQSDKIFTLTYVFMSDDDLLHYNKEFLNHDYYTDIITFTLDEDEDLIESDILISVDRVKENAQQNNVDFKSEFLRVILHGVLHLIGYNDKSDEESIEMRTKENFYLSQFLP